MAYDRDSFLAGVAVGRNMLGWPEMHGMRNAPLIFTITIDRGTFSLYNVIWRGYKGVISWGDGSESDYTEIASDYTITHDYLSAGTYVITILFSNDCPLYDRTQTLLPSVDVGVFNGVAGKLIKVNTPLPKIYENMILANLFIGCSNLTTVPDNLFENTPNITDIQRCFLSCSSLTTVPGNLFANLTKVRKANALFEGCSALRTIPSGLFDTFQQVTDFNYAFGSCSALVEIPEGLFDNCTEVIDFHDCFYRCTSLTSIPDDLFDNCPNVRDFYACFDGDYGITAAVPELWIAYPSIWRSGRCFRGCYNAANYESIPESWGGPSA